MMKKTYRHYFLISMSVLCMSFLFSCGSGPGDIDIGKTAKISLEYCNLCGSWSCEPYPIPADGFTSIPIRATLTDRSGDPVYVLTTITFYTTLGHFPGGATSYSVDTQGPWGITEISLMAGTTSGVAFITCSSNDVTQADYTVFTDYDAIDVVGNTASITLTADPTTLPADGSSSTTITATLTDIAGDPVEARTYVSFHTDSGKFPNNSVTYTVQTPDETGVVRISLRAGTGGEKANVCAYSDGVNQCIAVEYTYPEEEEEE